MTPDIHYMKDDMKILLIEDNGADALLIKEMLKEGRASTSDPSWVTSLTQGLRSLSEEPFDALLLDLGLPDSQGIGTLQRILSEAPETAIIILTGLADEILGVDAVQTGAQDYLVKGSVSADLLVRSIRYSIERKRLMMELHKASICDELTGLHNRRGFFKLAVQQMKLAKRQRSGIMFVVADVDGLKEINDALGHEEGDLAIKDAATVLKATFRESDVIGRIGGDEFAVIAPERTPAKIEIIMSRLQERIDSLRRSTKRKYKLSISIGIAHSDPDSLRSVDEMLSEADRGMYAHKRRKKESLSIKTT